MAAWRERQDESRTPLHEFLAEDFAAIGAGVIDRCMKLDGHRIYLAGATGFFGKNLLALLSHLRSRGASFEVSALSRRPAMFLGGHPWWDAPWITWLQGDAADPWPGAGAHSLLVHAATDTAADAHRDGLEAFNQMVSISRRAMEFAGNRGVRRVLLCGSGAQYGAIAASGATRAAGGAGAAEQDRAACDSTAASSAYGEAKRVGELLGALHASRHGFEVVNSRCFAFVGPGLPLDGHFAIGNFLRDALAGTPIRMSSSGAAVRSYLYGADLAVWLLLLLLEAPAGAAINVGSDQPLSIFDLAQRVRGLVNHALEVIPGPVRPADERQYYVPSIACARALGLEPWTALDRAILRTAAWHRNCAGSRGMAT
jgi:nucleoside-diphosphate-sugar epimerase